MVVDTIHIDKKAVAFSVRSIEPHIKSLHEDFQHIVIGLMNTTGGPNYVYTHLRESCTYRTIKLDKHLVIKTRIMFVVADKV
jgi:hypothetical protein